MPAGQRSTLRHPYTENLAIVPCENLMSITSRPSMGVSRIFLCLLATTPPIIGAAHAASASPSNGQSERLTLCSRSIALSGLEQDMDETIRKTAENSFTSLKAAFPDDTKTAAAYRDSIPEAMTATKAPVLDSVQKSCAAAFTRRNCWESTPSSAAPPVRHGWRKAAL